MLRVSTFEFIVRIIPEGFIFMFAAFALCNIKISVKKYIISSLLLAICVFTIRMLPINYGVHTILNIIIMTIITCSINRGDIILSIKCSIITTIGLFILEALNMMLLSAIFKEQLKSVVYNIILKTIYGLPSLICFAVISTCYYVYLIKKDRLRYV